MDPMRKLMTDIKNELRETKKITGEYTLTEDKYKSDEDIADEFKGMIITDITVNRSGNSGWINIEFPAGGEHVGGGTDEVSDHWIKYDHSGKIAFDNWYPEEVYNTLVAAINDKLGASDTDINKEKVQKGE